MKYEKQGILDMGLWALLIINGSSYKGFYTFFGVDRIYLPRPVSTTLQSDTYPRFITECDSGLHFINILFKPMKVRHG